jgi:GW (Gly-Tryp) dipeptide domain
MSKFSNFLFLVILITIFSCKSKPKVIVEDAAPSNTSSVPVVSAEGASTPATTPVGTSDMHNVEAIEILQAERYTYMKVKENKEAFWIAAAKFEPKVGNTYFYRGGLLKTNFESIEHKRVFDKIFLVSSIIDATAHPTDNLSELPTATTTENVASDFKPKKVVGGLKLSDLFSNKDKYSGRLALVSGKVVKANYEILNTNWYHIQDGSKKDGKVCDFTITSKVNIPMGAEVAFSGKIILNKDFGSGYKYDILMENGDIK